MTWGARTESLLNLDKPMSNRRSGSLVTLAVRHAKVIEAYKAKDETAARYELEQLAKEARLISKQAQLWP